MPFMKPKLVKDNFHNHKRIHANPQLTRDLTQCPRPSARAQALGHALFRQLGSAFGRGQVRPAAVEAVHHGDPTQAKHTWYVCVC